MSKPVSMSEDIEKVKQYDLVYFTWADFHGLARSRCVTKCDLDGAVTAGVGLTACT